jgi:hypothetical protein
LTGSGNLCFYAQDFDDDMIFAVLDVEGHFRGTKWAPLAVAVYASDWMVVR